MNIENGRWGAETRDEGDFDAATRRKRRRLILIAAGIVILVGLIAFALGHKKPADNSAPTLPTVSVMKPGLSPVANAITATGTLSARRDMPVGIAGAGGKVSRVLVDAGDWVKAGQVLATVDPAVQSAQVAQMKAQIASAQADAQLAQSNLDRAEALVSRGFISKADIDAKRAARDGAVAKVNLARAQYREQAAQLGRLDVRAPDAGLVLQRNVEPGQIVSSGSPALFDIAKDGMFEMQAKLAEQDLAAVHVGMPAQVTPVGSNKSFDGTVWQVSPIIDPTTRQGTARIAVPYAPAIRPGGFATAFFTADHRQAPVLPESAILSDEKGNYVYIIDKDDRVVRRDVKIGDVSDKGIAILGGLTGEERVVVSAGAFLNPGEKVIPDLKRPS
ncbi:MAG TPA: efflux RND transporter periplasmic adaptor subunit [Sphingomonas sp.]|nr:efflux RND transporter periplasmic adaptor subunit [Sphingomonas sp.]